LHLRSHVHCFAIEEERHETIIKYRHTTGTTEDWHREIASFITRLTASGAQGRSAIAAGAATARTTIISRCSTTRRIALARDFFKHYTEATRLVSGGSVEVVPLEMIAETA
jgi:hypothetical protein